MAGYNVVMPEQENKRMADDLYAESIRLRKIADLLVEKSEIISTRAYAPTDSGLSRITEIDRELTDLGWAMPKR